MTVDSLVFAFQNIELVSTNHAYLSLPKYLPAKNSKIRRNGKPVRVSTYRHKAPAYDKMMKAIDEAYDLQVDDNEVSEFKKQLINPQKSIRITADFGFSEDGYFSRDTSNYIKVLEDIIKLRVGIDDTRNVEVHLTKHILKMGDWNTLLKLEVIDNPEYITREWNSDFLRGS